MLNQARIFFLPSISIVLALVVANGKSVGRDLPVARQFMLQAGAPVVRTIDGHTEYKGTPSTDDGYQCFKRDDTRDLVLVVNAPEVEQNLVSASLYDLKLGTVYDPPTIDVTNHTATVTFSDARHRQKKRTERNPFVHLGPGPYVAAVMIGGSTERGNKLGNKGQSGVEPVVLSYPYVTYIKDTSECPAPSSAVQR
jgi:hypothetical protein